MKQYYTIKDYMVDFNKLTTRLSSIKAPINIVGLNRGSLPLAVHLSNVLDAPMSIINYQTRDGDCKEPVWVVDTVKKGETMILVDDIYDSGKTIKDVHKLLDTSKPNVYNTYTIYGKPNHENVIYYRENFGEWIVFPWEWNGVDK